MELDPTAKRHQSRYGSSFAGLMSSVVPPYEHSMPSNNETRKGYYQLMYFVVLGSRLVDQ